MGPRSNGLPVKSSSCSVALIALVVGLAGCAAEQARWTPPARSCPGALRPVWVADSSLTICVVTSFRTHDLQTWHRDREGSVPDLFEIRATIPQTLSVLTGGWPPTLAGAPAGAGRAGAGADRVSVREDTVAGHLARTEIGVRTDGSGQRTYAFISGWSVGDSLRGVAQGQSASRATLDTLLLMMRTAQPWKRAANAR